MKIKSRLSHGIISLKLEFIPTLSFEAQGVLSQMVNLPNCDFRTAEELQKMFPVDSVETYQNALIELADKKFVILKLQNSLIFLIIIKVR